MVVHFDMKKFILLVLVMIQTAFLSTIIENHLSDTFMLLPSGKNIKKKRDIRGFPRHVATSPMWE